EVLEFRVIEVLDVDALVVAIRKYVSRAINRVRGELRPEAGGDAHHHIAHARVEGLTIERALEKGTPIEAHLRSHGVAEHLGDLVLYALELDIGIGHVAWIGADDKLLRSLRLVGALGCSSDRDLLARREIIDLFAQVSADRGFSRAGRERSEAEAGNAKRRHQDARKHGGLWLFRLAMWAVRVQCLPTP